MKKLLQDIKSEVEKEAKKSDWFLKIDDREWSSLKDGELSATGECLAFIEAAIDRAVSEARKGTKVEGYTFEKTDWGDGVISDEPVEDKTISFAEAHGFNRALAQVQKSWQSFMGKGEGEV